MFAAENNHEEVLQLLLKRKADHSLRNKVRQAWAAAGASGRLSRACCAAQHGDTALSYAAESGSLPCLKALLKVGAKVDNVDVEARPPAAPPSPLTLPQGWTPLHEAARNGHTECVRELLARGAKVNPSDLSGFTPLCWAAKYGKNATVQLLLDAGADVNARNAAGFTPLQLATDADATETVRLLLKHGAAAKLQNNEGQSAWHIARQRSVRIQSMLAAAVANEPSSPFGSLGGSPSLGAFAVPSALSPGRGLESYLQRTNSLPRVGSLPRSACGSLPKEAPIAEARPMKSPGGGLGGAIAAAAAEGESLSEVAKHLESVSVACGLAGFSISVTWPTDGAGGTAGVDASGTAVGTHTISTPTIKQLAYVLHALQLDAPEVYAQFMADSECHRQEAVRSALSEEEGRTAQMALLAITRQKARAARCVEDAQFDLEEAELQLASARKAVQVALPGSEAAAQAEDEVRQKKVWRDRKAASLEAAQEMLASAEKL